MAVVARSRSQFDAYRTGQLPPVEQIRPGVFALPSPMEGSYLHYSLTYAIAGNGNELHLVDTGLGSDLHWEALQDNLSTIGRQVADVATVTITHLHRDHAGLATRLREASGATVRMHGADARAIRSRASYVEPGVLDSLLNEWGVPSERRESLVESASRHVAGGTEFVVDEELDDGQAILAGSAHLRILHTPGHTRGHVIVINDDAGLVFTGDHLLPMIHSGVGLGGWGLADNPIDDYLESLDRVHALDAYDACPGHGYQFAGIAARATAAKAHLLQRGEEIQAIRREHPRLSTWEVASRVSWSAGWENLHGGHLLSAVLQTAWHKQREHGDARYTT